MIGAPEIISAAIEASSIAPVHVIIAEGSEHTRPLPNRSFHKPPINMQMTTGSVPEVMSALRAAANSSIDLICLREDGTVLGFHGRQIVTVEVRAPSGLSLATVTTTDDRRVSDIRLILIEGEKSVRPCDIQLIHGSKILDGRAQVRDFVAPSGMLEIIAVHSNFRLAALEKACDVPIKTAEYLLDFRDSHISFNPPVSRRMVRHFQLDEEHCSDSDFIENLRSTLAARRDGQSVEYAPTQVHATPKLRPIGRVSLMDTRFEDTLMESVSVIDSLFHVVSPRLSYTLVYQDWVTKNTKMLSSAPVKSNEPKHETRQAARSRSRSRRLTPYGVRSRSRSRKSLR